MRKLSSQIFIKIFDKYLNKMDGGWEKVRKEVTCGVCLAIFKEPKMLPCLHTFCAKCLQVLWQQAADKVIRCPQCRATAPAIGSSVKALPLNFSAARLVDIVEMQDRLFYEETPPTCQSCQDKKDAVASCTPCGIFLCKSCLGVHKTLRLTSSHQINSLADIKSGKVTVPSILDHSQEMCTIHPDKPLELYCKRDKCLICLGCAVVQHRSHEYDFISQIAKEQKEEVFSTLPNFREHMKHVKRIAAEVKQMQDQVQERRQNNVDFINRAFLEIANVLSTRKQQLLDSVEKTTVNKIKALNEQHEDLANLYDQMNSYLELVEVKLKSERDRAILATKDQMVNRGSSLLKVVRSTRSTPIETAPPKVEFPRLQNVLDLTKLLGISFCSKTCTLVEITQNASKPTFQVRARDSMHRPISNCASLLDVKIIPYKDSEGKDVEVPKITNKGNGCYEFSTLCDNSLYYYTHSHMQVWQRDRIIKQRYGLVIVRLFGEDVPESPLK